MIADVKSEHAVTSYHLDCEQRNQSLIQMFRPLNYLTMNKELSTWVRYQSQCL